MGSYYLTVSQIRELDARILAALIASCGITSPADAEALAGPHSFTVDTDGGEVQVSYSPGYKADMSNRGKVGLAGSVYCRFTDPAKAAKLLSNVNHYSGKWNFHFGGMYEPEAMADAIRAINPRNFTLRARYWYPGAVDSTPAV